MPSTESPASPRILLVDDDPTAIHTVQWALADTGALYFASHGLEAMRLLGEVRPDVVLLNAELPDLTGFQVLEMLRADPELADVPVLVVTRRDDDEVEQAALDLGAVDCLTKPLRPATVAMRVATQLRLKAAHDRLRLAAALDPLTGLANRRAFDNALDREWRRCLRSGQPVSLLAIDVDRARRLNDHYGHGTGDRCLAAVAGQLRDCVRRPFDVVARYGGDDFMVLLPETDSDGALRVGRRMASAVAALALADAASEAASLVTVSIGATSYDAACTSWLGGDGASFTVIDPGVEATDLLAAADLALHVAKRRGGAQQCFRSIDAAVDAKQSAA